MADEPEVIQRELDETRHSLAEKLGAIGEKVSGTVENVTETVESVTETVEQTVEAVTGTVQAVGETAQETVEAVKQAFNFSEQYENHPWLFFAGSVALGFVGGKLVENVGSRRERAPEPHFHSSHRNGNGHAETYATRAAERFFEEPIPTASSADQGNGKAKESGPTTSWLGRLAEHFGGELNKLKGLALGTMFGVARDMITQALPQKLKSELGNVFDSMTETAGGKPIHGPILEEEHQEGPELMKGEDREKSDPTEMDRPVGTAPGKGKAGMGKSQRR
jgi:ElaB/YqjD/DUF883 family membrane-anchored ribosome-binding protein